MNTILIYNSKTGFTKKYADWIADELKCKVISYKDCSGAIIRDNDVVIFGSRLHAGRIEHLNKIKQHSTNAGQCKLIVFTTGATPNAAENVINKMWSENFTESELKSIPHFYMQGGLNYEEMGFLDRKIMKAVAKLMGNKKADDENNILSGFEHDLKSSYNISSKEYIEPLISMIKSV